MSLNKFAIKCIKKYQQNKELIGSGRCKKYPSCSNYAIGCYEKFNFVKASFLSFFRILRCNPFTKKCYDPVPLNREEKKKLRSLKNELNTFADYLEQINKIYPLMKIEDYIVYIYEATFGPYFLKDSITHFEELNYLNPDFNKPIYYEKISDDYIRIYNYHFSHQDLEQYFEQIKSLEITNELIQIFNYRLYLLKKLVKKKIIKLNYKNTFNIIEEYLVHDLTYLNHSDEYSSNYNTNYIIKEVNKN